MRLAKTLLFALVFFPGLANAQTTKQMIERYPKRDTLVVNVGKSILYAGPSMGTEELSTVIMGTYVFSVRDARDFYQVFTLDNRYGFIAKTDVTTFSKTSNVKAFVSAPLPSTHLAVADSTGVRFVQNPATVNQADLAAIREDVADIKLIMILWSVISLIGVGVAISSMN
jgi:hypothetical protein